MPSDATPAYRGYRLQALYALWQILESEDSAHLIFQPEGHEDLAIFDSNETLLEVVQVKAHEGDLALSSLLPPKPKPGLRPKRDSFFYRAASLLEMNSQLEIRIVSFGTIGPELLRAFQMDGPERENIAKKLHEHKNLSERDINNLLTKIRPVSVDAATLTKRVQTILGESLMGTDPESAFDLLNYWLYICAENKEKITRREVVEKVNKVGRFLADRAAHYQEWFTSIIPIEDKDIASQKEDLSDEFYQGIAAQYSHVLAGLDVPRPQKLQEIAGKFMVKRVVIVHAASGQGKTTLAYRYLHDFIPDKWRFQVQLTESRTHALRIARALVGHADAINIPMVVYIDVSSSDNGWPELVKQLSFHQNIHVLVTIREEDWRRASISGVEIQFSSVDLTFEDTEAQEIYQSLREKHLPVALLGFQEAWRRFGGEGPLMEFVYLVTSGNSLRERLSQQVRHLEDEVREGRMQPAELELLRLVSVASAYEAHLKIKPLVEYLNLPAPSRTFKLLENEYLLRQVADGSLVYGLHPLRSAIVADLLTDSTFSPWSESARQCIPYLYEPDVETFLLYAFSRRPTEAKLLLTFLEVFQPDHWVAIAGVTRSLLWIGIREYIDNNQQLILEVFKDLGPGWYMILDFDIADAIPGSGTSLWKNLGYLLSQEGQQRIEAFQARQTDKKQVFARARAWLSLRTQKPEAAVSVADWASIAETLFWVGSLGIQWPVAEWFTDDVLERTLDSLPIDVLADLIVGLSYSYGALFPDWLERHRIKLIDRYRREMQISALEDDGQKLTLHFIIAIEQLQTAQSGSEQNNQNAEDGLHREAIQRVELVRRLLPDRETYACQGYGHRIWAKPLPFDSTLKTGIPKSGLPLSWLTSINATFRGLAEQHFRPTTWQEYAQEVFVLRQAVVQVLKQLETELDAYFRKSVAVQLPGNHIRSDDWLHLQRSLHKYPLLPSCALDEWGFVDEYTAGSADQQRKEIQPLLERRGLIIQEYMPFLPTYREYIRTLDNFFQQAIGTMIFNSRFGKGKHAKAEKHKAVEQLEPEEKDTKEAPLSTINLADAVKVLLSFQLAYRQLLSQYVDEKVLAGIERQEQDLYYRVWSIWYFFAYHPHLIITNAEQECPKQVIEILKKIRHHMQQEFDRRVPNLRVTIISKASLWESNRALWITVDGKNAVEVYNAVEQVIATIRYAIGESEDTELRQHVLDFYWPCVFIVPLLRSRNLNALAWRIPLPVLLREGGILGLNWWNFVPQSISPEDMTNAGIVNWNLPRLEDATVLMKSTAELMLLLGHIRDFKSLPELDEYGNELLQHYVQSLAGRIGKIIQTLENSVRKIAFAIAKIDPADYIHYPNLKIVAQALQEFENYIVPPSYSQGEGEMNYNQIIEWANQLEKASEYSSLIYLAWASDIVDKAEM